LFGIRLGKLAIGAKTTIESALAVCVALEKATNEVLMQAKQTLEDKH
jgi:hypothetical protein